eukprot:359178-Chlamydomonas_euryale.AAC.5
MAPETPAQVWGELGWACAPAGNIPLLAASAQFLHAPAFALDRPHTCQPSHTPAATRARLHAVEPHRSAGPSPQIHARSSAGVCSGGGGLASGMTSPLALSRAGSTEYADGSYHGAFKACVAGVGGMWSVECGVWGVEHAGSIECADGSNRGAVTARIGCGPPTKPACPRFFCRRRSTLTPSTRTCTTHLASRPLPPLPRGPPLHNTYSNPHAPPTPSLPAPCKLCVPPQWEHGSVTAGVGVGVAGHQRPATSSVARGGGSGSGGPGQLSSKAPFPMATTPPQSLLPKVGGRTVAGRN